MEPGTQPPRPFPAGWALYMAGMTLFALLLIAPPLLMPASPAIAGPMYAAWGYTCHQLDARSLCYDPRGPAIVDCRPQDGVFRPDRHDTFDTLQGTLYKIPVCARDVGIYGAMLIGGLALPFVRPAHGRKWPPLWPFLLALIPTALDGTTQLMGWRESSNALRLASGFAMGILVPFYVVPALNQVLAPKSGGPKERAEGGAGREGRAGAQADARTSGPQS